MYRLNESVRLRSLEADGSHWAFDIASGAHFELNESALRVLVGVQQGKAPLEIAALFCAEYGLSSNQATADVEAALATLAAEGLIEKEEKP